MKKIILFSVFCIFMTNIATTNAAPILSDDLPPEYVKEIKSRPIVRDDAEFPEYEKKTATVVKIHAKEKITFTPYVLPQIKPLSVNTIVKNAKMNDRYTFIVAEDVYKNNKLLIKKGSKAIGILRKAHLGLYEKGPVPEIKIGLFTTNDVNGNKINLKGAIVLKPYPQLGNVVIGPKTIFTVYYQ